MTVPLSASTPMRFGIAIRPLKVSERSHARVRSMVAPMIMNPTNTILKRRVDLVPKRYSKPLLPYWLQPRTVENAKNRMAIAINPAPARPYTVEKASATSAVDT